MASSPCSCLNVRALIWALLAAVPPVRCRRRTGPERRRRRCAGPASRAGRVCRSAPEPPTPSDLSDGTAPDSSQRWPAGRLLLRPGSGAVVRGGFRATSGLFDRLAQRRRWPPRHAIAPGGQLHTRPRSRPRRRPLGTDAGTSRCTVPYLGIGYSGPVAARRLGLQRRCRLVLRAQQRVRLGGASAAPSARRPAARPAAVADGAARRLLLVLRPPAGACTPARRAGRLCRITRPSNHFWAS